MNKIFICLAIALSSLSMAADNYICLSKNNVNLREAPSTSAPVVDKGKIGTVFIVEETKDGWYKGKNAQYGDNPVWISASVSEKGYVGDVKMPAWSFVNSPETPVQYMNSERSAGGEVQNIWTFTSSNPNFWKDEKPGSSIEAHLNTTVIYKNGSVRAYEKYYKGEAFAYYFKLMEESLDGDEYSNLETPLYVYPNISGESGVYVDGVYFYDDVLGDDW